MMTVNEVSKLTGVSIRTLQYYDKIDLLCPAAYTQAGYRLYDDQALEKLQQILLFRELEFPLKDIKKIIESPSFNREKALRQQITLLELKKERIEDLIALARGIKETGVNHMNFSAFNAQKEQEYKARAKASWGNTPEYREYEEKTKSRTALQQNAVTAQMMDIFAELGKIRHSEPSSENAQTLIQYLQDFISKHFYTCSDEILASLGEMYKTEEFAANIDKAGGKGTATFASRAIEIYVKNN